MPELARSGTRIHYEIWGDAPGTVLLVNGHTRPLNDFRLMGRHLMEQGLRVIALDNRGAGLTTTTRPYTLAEMADDAVAVADEVLGVTATFDLLGVSMGGFIAQTVALANPERVRRLVLVSTAARQTAIRKDDTPWTADLGAVERKLAPFFTDDFARKNAVLVKSMVKQIAKAVETGGFAGRADEQKRAAAGFDVYARLPYIKHPVLVIHGDQDQIVPLQAGSELAAGLPHATFNVMTGAGHLLLAERPKDLYQAVAEFLRG